MGESYTLAVGALDLSPPTSFVVSPGRAHKHHGVGILGTLVAACALTGVDSFPADR